METAMDDAKGVTPNIGAAYEITVFDKDGKVRQVINEDAKCYVQNFLRYIKYCFLNGVYAYHNSSGTFDGTIASNFKNLSGSVVAASGIPIPTINTVAYGAFLANGAVGDVTRGVVVGSDDTSVAEDDYALNALIANGTGSGQVSYDANVISLNIVGSVMTITIARMINNASLVPVIISEFALYLLGTISIMVLRDVVTPSVTLGSGESALFVYKLIING
jgi:hypothetical protein